MPVQFILGRAGSGKTRHLLDQMIELTRADPLGPPIFWLLPRQATFQAERLLTARLESFSRIRVVSFDQFGKDILIHCGDVGIPEVTALGRRMLIGHLLRLHQAELKFYSSSAHRRGLAAELDAAFGEFERAGLDAPALDELLQTLCGDDRTDPTLRDKLFDLHLLLSAYNRHIGQEKLDPQRRLSLILKRVCECSFLKDAHLFVDDFYDFTAHERRFLTAIAGAVRNTRIALLIDPESEAVKNPAGMMTDLSVFHRTERTYRALLGSLGQAGLVIARPVVLRGNHRAVAADLAAIEQGLFSDAASSVSAVSIQAIEAPDIREEVDAVARRIRSLVAGGARYRQIGVLVRALGEYQEIIDASFAEHGLPYFADRRRTAAHHPLLRMVRAALQIARRDWPDEAVMTLVKSGLAGLSDDQADELENYVLQHRIHGRMWEAPEPWMFSRELIIAEDESGQPVLSESARIDSYRRSLLDKLAPLLELNKGQSTVREMASRVFTVLESFGVRAALRQWMDQAEEDSELERRDEHEQVWSGFVQMFDHMVDLLGEQPITLVDFMDVLDSGLESFDLALTPVKVDEILVGQIDRTRPPELKVVFVLGMNEGSFPHSADERCVITDRERRMLRRRNIDLDPDSERQLLDERFLAYLAFTRASQKLIISRARADQKERATNPSSFWQELFRLVPDIPVQQIVRSFQPNVEQIGTPRQLVTDLMRWVRGGAQEAHGQAWPALYQWLVTTSGHGLASMRDRAWPALRYTNKSHLNEALARELFPSPLQVNARQLETAAECPFRHFARYGLRLRGREQPDVTGIDLSNAYHDILENLVADLLAATKDWCELKPAEAAEMIRLHAAEIGRRLRGELMLSTARNRHMLDRIEQNLRQAVATMCEIHRRGKYRPAFVNLRFGEGGKLPAHSVTTPAGKQVQLHGQIDRVDLNARRTAFVVDDYKMSSSPLALDRVYHGLSLQLLTHLLVIEANGELLVGQKLTPAAAFLLQLLRSPEKVDHPGDAILVEDPDFHLRVKPRGIIEQRAIPSLDQKLTEGGSVVINAYINKTGEVGRRGFSDVAEKSEFDALLRHVETRIGELADRITTGDITVAPYMIARQTPCSRCEYRSVCRFEPGINRYRMLAAMKREDVLVAVTNAR